MTFKKFNTDSQENGIEDVKLSTSTQLKFFGKTAIFCPLYLREVYSWK